MPPIPRPGGDRRIRRPPRARGIALLLLLLIPSAAAADSEDELERWVPGFALFFGMLGQKANGAISIGPVLGPPLTTTDALGTGCLLSNPPPPGSPPTRNGGLCQNSPAQIRPDSNSSDTSIEPLVEGAFELMTPRVFEGAFDPRLFAHADISFAFAFERNLAGEAKPGAFVPPELPPTQNDIPEIAIEGQGSRAKSEVDLIVGSAGGGVAFTTKIFDRTVRIKPSFEWLVQNVKIKGEVNRAVKQVQPANQFNTLNDFRLIQLDATDTHTQHALGGGLEIEADAGRLGPLALSMFILGRGYGVISDRDYTLTASNEYGETATWTFHFEPAIWRAGAGLRFRWLPE
jgi:hypothetical protein